MFRLEENRPVAVPARATRAGAGPSRWLWTEPRVWTAPMLAALDRGVKGGKWYSLIDKIHPIPTLEAAFRKVLANEGAAGVDHVTVHGFKDHLDENLKRLSKDLQSGHYRPQAIRRHYIPKPGTKERRPLGIPTVRDRVVQTAMRMALEPIFERDFAEHSYGFRPGRGCKDALRRVDELLKQGYTHVVDADLKSYFDTIPHDRLLELVRQKVSDGRVLGLIEAFLKQGIFEDLREWTPEAGTPQGAVISPLLSNIYLDPLDQMMAEKGMEMVRYADDFVILCRSPEEAAQALEAVRQWTASVGLSLHPTKTRIVDAQTEGFDFLGYTFRAGERWPRQKSLDRLRTTVRAKTKRSSGQSLQVIIADLNMTLRGWFEYFKHSHRWTFSRVDRWIRVRLRSILRKRLGLRGRSRGKDHQRWPDAFLAKQGLLFLATAHAQACQSSRR